VDYIKTVKELLDFIKAESFFRTTANTFIVHKINVLGKHEIVWRIMLVLCCQWEHKSYNVNFNSEKDKNKLSNTADSTP
jgi:hypothetical protein